MEVVPERVYILELPDRLKISRSRVYQLLDQLKINTQKVGNKAYITSEDYLRLIQVQDFIRKGKSIAEFLLEHPQEVETSLHQDISTSDRQSNALTTGSSSDFLLQATPEALELLFSKLMGLVPLAPVPDPVERLKVRLETLAICVRDKVVLTNHELAELLGSNYNTIRKNEKFSQYGYTFTRHKEGRSISWSITKED